METLRLQVIHNNNKLLLESFQNIECCDFRNCFFENIRIENKLFLGCHFNSIIFKNVVLKNCIFKGCFCSDNDYTIILNNSLLKDNLIEYSNLNFKMGEYDISYKYWNNEISNLLCKSIDKENIQRYDAVQELLKLKIKDIYLPLSVILLDKEWEIKTLYINSLLDIDEKIDFIGKENIFNAIYTLLNDPNGIVLSMVTSFIRKYNPPLMLIETLMNTHLKKIYSLEEKEILEGIRIWHRVLELNKSYHDLCLFDKSIEQFNKLLIYANNSIKIEVLNLSKKLDSYKILEGIIICLNNKDFEIRQEALNVISYFSKPLPIETYIMLFDDPIAQVREQCLLTTFYNGYINDQKVQKIINRDLVLQKKLKEIQKNTSED
ncbi:MAG: hypothetical protein MUE53_09825 [Chitinophagales bacterium]|jgi:hypothetical protein|nr:hypothetical protein [Chitinophagales bacterium]